MPVLPKPAVPLPDPSKFPPKVHIEPPAPRGRFRFTLTGFTCERETTDHILEVDDKGDEVYFLLDRAFVTATGQTSDLRRIGRYRFYVKVEQVG
jgi:hypothetical protein